MRKQPTDAQENSLRKLFSGNQSDIERVIALQRPEMRQPLREVIRVRSNSDKLIQILFQDLKKTTEEMKRNPGDQYWRRAAIRTVASTIDGIIFCFKEMALATAGMNGVQFGSKELEFLRERTEASSGKPSKPKFVVFRDNLKGTFKLFAAACKCACPTDFNKPGFSALCDTYELRHRIIHPKNYMTFCVKDAEKQMVADAIQWLDTEIQALLNDCTERVGQA